MYSLKETAIVLNLKENEIRSLIRRGRLKSDLIGGQRVIQKAVLYQFILTVAEFAP